ncbi:hypothetical protein B484DRAFT_390431 [Ochromonadaceae sp. CCMP2298]|nr:hypothetical protein B484DRAFT_390431 [Ochromonadaceae sp. CCMP2298]
MSMLLITYDAGFSVVAEDCSDSDDECFQETSGILPMDHTLLEELFHCTTMGTPSLLLLKYDPDFKAEILPTLEEQDDWVEIKTTVHSVLEGLVLSIHLPEPEPEPEPECEMVIASLEDIVESLNTEEERTQFEEAWQKKKEEVEQMAEINARQRFRQWQSNNVSIDQAMEESLRPYGEMYENAHAIKLQFEAERDQFTAKLLRLCRDQASLKRDRDTAWPDVTPDRSIKQRGSDDSMDDGFQYTVDDEVPTQSLSSMLASASVSTVTPMSSMRVLKKFSVPTKQGSPVDTKDPEAKGPVKVKKSSSSK